MQNHHHIHKPLTYIDMTSTIWITRSGLLLEQVNRKKDSRIRENSSEEGITLSKEASISNLVPYWWLDPKWILMLKSTYLWSWSWWEVGLRQRNSLDQFFPWAEIPSHSRFSLAEKFEILANLPGLRDKVKFAVGFSEGYSHRIRAGICHSESKPTYF